MSQVENNLSGVAIIGIAGRWPGADSPEAFWRNLVHGVESISQLREDELESGDATLWSQPNFVKARGMLDGVDMFDAEFWGMYPKEAEMTDPQQRVFLECAWQALEDAGYDPQGYAGAIGVFAGCSMNTYFLRNISSDRQLVEDFTGSYQVGSYGWLVGNHADFLATRVAYKLNLRGPAFTMNCGCSTSLVAVAQACQSILNYQSDMALAGGVSISFPQKRGYLYQPDGMVSPDGHCRTFDADAQGTVFGSGAAVVLLKRLEEAVADGDHIYAVIKGFAVNNDGSAKVGFAAPGVDGQAQVIATAQAVAGVEAESIGYLECHGTATPLGDPIEIAAAAKAFGASTKARGFCALGSAKPNVGHLDVAAGATGLIKTALSLHNELLPATLHFEKPSPKLNLENSPFFVNSKLTEWKRKADDSPRRAGVSAFGVGGTNAHVVLEEAPHATVTKTNRNSHLLLVSAKTSEALDAASSNLAEHLRQNPETNLADVAYTLQTGRRVFGQRRYVLAADSAQAAQALRTNVPPTKDKRSGSEANEKTSLVFMFPGQGAQYPLMGAQLYASEPEFCRAIDECADILKPILPRDLRDVLYNPGPDRDLAAERLKSTVFAQPAIFTTEYALAKLWMSWGVQPDTMIGHSVGEFVAACLSGVFSLEDALKLVAERGRLMQGLPPGAMLAVRLPEDELRSRLTSQLSIAAVNSPGLCVVSGSEAEVSALESALKRDGIMARHLQTSHAFHSAMMDPVIPPFTRTVERVVLSANSIPYVSCVSGSWAKAEQTTSPSYWATHLRQPVRFADGIKSLGDHAILLEVGPGNTLTTLALQNLGSGAIAISSLPDASRTMGDMDAVLNALGRLWVAGRQPDWKKFHSGETLHRVSLPTYPFQRKRFWMEPKPNVHLEVASQGFASSSVTDFDHSNFLPPIMEIAQATTSMEGTTAMSELLTARVSGNSRRERLQSEVRSLFQELSGMDADQIDASATFTELGFDSLFLTQATQELQQKFGVKITFRQLLDQQSSVFALAAFLDEKMPAKTASTMIPAIPDSISPQRVSSAAHVGAVAPDSFAAGSQDAVHALMQEQLRTMSELMARQLDAVRGNTVAPTRVISTAVEGPALRAFGASVETAVPAVAKQTASKEEPKAFGPYKPLSKGPSGGLTAAQDRHIASLIERYTRKTPKSKALTQRYRKVMADPRVVAGFRSQWKEIVYPLVTERSAGSKLYDIDGNEYIDILNGYGPTVFGHRPKFVTDAVREQLDHGFEIGPMSPLAGEVAELVSELTGMERVAFTNTGSEAVVCAMRVARTATGRNKIVMFTGDYHGMFDEVLIRGIKRAGAAPRSAPIAPGIPPQAAENIVVLDYGSSESLEYIRAHAHEFAAVMVEPVQSRHPNLQPREFLQELRKITAEAGTAFIFDEVVTGFRTHPGGAQAIFGIRADMATYGKVIGGGLPIGILTGKSQFMDTLDGGAWQYGDDSFPEVGVTFFAGTFVRHPLALAATRSVLMHLKEQGPQLQENLNAKTEKMVARINAMLEARQAPLRVENFASIFYFIFPTDLRFGTLFYYHMRERGVHVQEGFPCFLTTAHSDADIDKIVIAFEQSISAMQADGLLPGIGEAIDTSVPTASSSTSHIEVADAPLTEAQTEIWLAAQMGDEASCAFNESLTLHLDGRLHEPALRNAVQTVINRHDALRTRFSPAGDRQRFAQSLTLDLPLLDYSPLKSAVRDAKLAELKHREATTPFDLVNGPVARFTLVKLEPERYALIFTAHHIVCDGWSANVLLEELAKLYSAEVAGQSANLSPALSFGEYARKQPSGGSKEAEQYWLKNFGEPVDELALPLDRPRKATRSYEGATVRRKIGVENYKAIKRAGAKQGCTLFVTLLAGFEALLSRLSGQDDIVVGIPAAAQSLLEGQTLVGHGVNFLPLRSRLSEGMKFSELLKQQKTGLLDAYEHQEFTYGTLVRKLGLKRDLSRLPLMEVQFNLERFGSSAQFAGLNAEADPNPKAFVNFDLFLNIVESDHGLMLDCDYNSGLYDETTILRWLGHYETLLMGVVADTEKQVQTLPLLSETETQQMLVAWNATDAAYPHERGVHELFEEQAARQPSEVAVAFGDRRLTYGELNQKANQLAQHLIKIGAGRGSLVGIYMHRSTEMMVALLGALKAGAAYLPLDPAYPRERIDFIVDEAKLPVLLTQSDLAVTLSHAAARILCLDSDWEPIAGESSAKPSVRVAPEDLAYLIYTSGSTGKPKGVEIPHRAVVNLLTSMARTPGMSADDKMLAVTTLSFDIAALELFLPLIVGGQVILASREQAVDPLQLRALMRESHATIMQATPITWRMLLESGWDGRPLQKVLCGGEALPQDLADKLCQMPISLWNMYGPTETTIWSATSEVKAGKRVAIGPPIANTQFYILDAFNQPAPIGVAGELCIAGVGVARGYYKRPELTAQRFVQNPFRSGERMYRTGDRAHYRADGRIEFMGRFDQQVKLRGFRIELGEIESVLARHADVGQAVATLREDVPGDQRLVAYVTAKNGTQPIPAELRRFAGDSLPEYMIPSAFVTLPSLPLTANGKIDRKLLPRPTAAAGDLSTANGREFVAPTSAVETQLAQIWSEVLHMDRIGITDNILELGADSIHIFQITARAHKVGLSLSAKQLLQTRTIRELALSLSVPLSASTLPPKNGSNGTNGGRIQRVDRERYQVKG